MTSVRLHIITLSSDHTIVCVVVSTGEMMPKLILDGEEKMAVQKKVAASGVRSLKSSYGRRMKRLSLVIQHEEDKDEIDVRFAHT